MIQNLKFYMFFVFLRVFNFSYHVYKNKYRDFHRRLLALLLHVVATRCLPDYTI
jgi:hypothetical protein